MLNILILLFNFATAHESLSTTKCVHGDLNIQVEKISNAAYVFYDENQKTLNLTAPKVEDQWDKKNNQMFDTYSFKEQKLNLVIKRPETKGPVKSTIALYKGKIFKCL